MAAGPPFHRHTHGGAGALPFLSLKALGFREIGIQGPELLQLLLAQGRSIWSTERGSGHSACKPVLSLLFDHSSRHLARGNMGSNALPCTGTMSQHSRLMHQRGFLSEILTTTSMVCALALCPSIALGCTREPMIS